MRINIDKLGDILGKLKCEFAESIYNSYIKEKYSLRNFKLSSVRKTTLSTFPFPETLSRPEFISRSETEAP